MTPKNIPHCLISRQENLSKKINNSDIFFSQRESYEKVQARKLFRDFYRLKRGHQRINLKNPDAWAAFVYDQLHPTYRKTFDFMRMLEIIGQKQQKSKKKKKKDYKRGIIFISDKALAKSMGYSLATAERHIKKLCKYGLLWRHSYHPPKIACGGTERVMCTYMNTAVFREKHIHKFRKWAPLNARCINSFNQYNQEIIRYQEEFCREEREETERQIAIEKARYDDQIAYQMLENGIHEVLGEDEGSISQNPRRGSKAIYIQSNSTVFEESNTQRIQYQGLQLVQSPIEVDETERIRSLETEIIDQWLKSTKISCPNQALKSIQNDRTKQLEVIDAMCVRQHWLKDHRNEIIRAFNALWTLKHDLHGKNIQKNMVEYAIHVVRKGYLGELEDRVYRTEKKAASTYQDYPKLLPKLRWDEPNYPPEPWAANDLCTGLSRSLALELWKEHRNVLEKMGIQITPYAIEYGSDVAYTKVEYTNPMIYRELVLRAYNYGYLEVKDFLLSRIKPNSIEQRMDSMST